MDAEISDNTDGSEDARLHLYILVSGVLQRLFSIGAVLACFAASSRTIDRPRATASGVARQPAPLRAHSGQAMAASEGLLALVLHPLLSASRGPDPGGGSGG